MGGWDGLPGLLALARRRRLALSGAASMVQGSHDGSGNETANSLLTLPVVY